MFSNTVLTLLCKNHPKRLLHLHVSWWILLNIPCLFSLVGLCPLNGKLKEIHPSLSYSLSIFGHSNEKSYNTWHCFDTKADSNMRKVKTVRG